MKNSPKRSLTAVALVTAAASLLFLDSASAQYADSRDGYFRTVEGRAWVTPANSSSPQEVEPNLPVLSGDRLEVQPGGRIEVVLPDGTLVRIEAGTEMIFQSLAQAAESGESATILVLTQGELQLVASDVSTGTTLPRVDSVNASLFVQQAGQYLVSADDRSWTEVVVRAGYLEIATQRGSSFVRTGERASIEGAQWPRVSVEGATYLSSLELWGEELDSEARLASDNHLDSSLAYAGTALAYRGRWVETGGRSAWRPHVSVDWRPYTTGRWHSTPAGLNWVSYEPWGWLTHHYGSWSYSPGYGWLWYPGTAYSPAWVYWYWGSSQVAWTPVGIYTTFYGGHHGYGGFGFGFGYHHGIYGWAGGSARIFADWVFCDLQYFGRRNYSGYLRTGSQLARDTRYGSVGRGIITTDTRSITPDVLRRPTEIVAALGRSRRTRSGQTTGSRELTDVTSFIARRRELTPEVAAAVRGSRGTTSIADRSSRSPVSSGATRSNRTPETTSRLFRRDSPQQRSFTERSGDVGARRELGNRSPTARVFGGTRRSGVQLSLPQRSEDWRRPTTRQLPDRPTRIHQNADRESRFTDRGRTLYKPRSTDSSDSPRSNYGGPARTRRPSIRDTRRQTPVAPPVRRILDGVRSSTPSARYGTAAPSRPTVSTPSRRPTQSQARPVARAPHRSSGSTTRPPSSSSRSKAPASKSNQSKSRSGRSRSGR